MTTPHSVRLQTQLSKTESSWSRHAYGCRGKAVTIVCGVRLLRRVFCCHKAQYLYSLTSFGKDTSCRLPVVQSIILLQKTRRRGSTSEPTEEEMFKQWYRRLRVFQSAENLAADSPPPDPNGPSNFTQAWVSQTSLTNQCGSGGELHRAPTNKPIRQLFRPIKSKV